VPKSLGAGSEIDAYCTKCRMDLGHRIVAMVGTIPKRVECQTCGSHHNYRAPKTAREKREASKARTTRQTSAQRVTLAAKAEAERRSEWEHRVLGQPATAFTRFKITETFAPDQLVLHKKFGEGYVVELLEDGKVSIMFADGAKTLVHGRTS
jgi:hypothetical protein